MVEQTEKFELGTLNVEVSEMKVEGEKTAVAWVTFQNENGKAFATVSKREALRFLAKFAAAVESLTN